MRRPDLAGLCASALDALVRVLCDWLRYTVLQLWRGSKRIVHGTMGRPLRRAHSARAPHQRQQQRRRQQAEKQHYAGDKQHRLHYPAGQTRSKIVQNRSFAWLL